MQKLNQKKYNNKSNDVADWTTAELKRQCKDYYQSIYEIECYGSGDLQMYSIICAELERRGQQIKTKIEFD